MVHFIQSIYVFSQIFQADLLLLAYMEVTLNMIVLERKQK